MFCSTVTRMTLAKQGRPRTHERAADPRTSSMQNLSFHDLGQELQLHIFRCTSRLRGHKWRAGRGRSDCFVVLLTDQIWNFQTGNSSSGMQISRPMFRFLSAALTSNRVRDRCLDGERLNYGRLLSSKQYRLDCFYTVKCCFYQGNNHPPPIKPILTPNPNLKPCPEP